MDPKIMDGVDPAVARELQDHLDKLNAESKPDFDIPYTMGNTRHECKKARQSLVTGRAISTATVIHERYMENEAGDIALIYKEGGCKKCGFTARSLVGWAVLTAVRPPAFGRVGRA